jgi:hypothetical protein
MTSSMSHGNRSSPGFSVCARTSFSTNFWSSLFLLWEWIHPSTDQQCSHGDTESMTPETLYVNQASSLNRGSPVLLSVTPSTNVDIQVAWGSLSISGVQVPWTSSLTSSSKRYCTSNVVSHDCVSTCTKKDYGLHCHLLGAHSIHKLGISAAWKRKGKFYIRIFFRGKDKKINIVTRVLRAGWRKKIERIRINLSHLGLVPGLCQGSRVFPALEPWHPGSTTGTTCVSELTRSVLNLVSFESIKRRAECVYMILLQPNTKRRETGERCHAIP